jgi:hypothetical protein
VYICILFSLHFYKNTHFLTQTSIWPHFFTLQTKATTRAALFTHRHSTRSSTLKRSHLNEAALNKQRLSVCKQTVQHRKISERSLANQRALIAKNLSAHKLAEACQMPFFRKTFPTF